MPSLAVALLLAQSVAISGGVAPRLEQFRFRFDNPSSFDTVQAVPHFFEQRYDVIPVWFSADARYRLAGLPASTSAAMSVRGRTHGSDIDTFLQPTGDVVTSGTNGDVELHSWELSQRLGVGDARGWAFAVTAGYRRDRADFLPDDRVVTHTSPASIARTFITDRETTYANVLTLGLEAAHSRPIGDRWQMSMGAGFQPLVRARLLVQLPDKYPGVDLVFNALSVGASAHWTMERRATRWRAGVTVSGRGAWAFRRSSAYALKNLSLGVFAGR